jgi:hypothetical protein
MRKVLFESPYCSGLSFSDLFEKHRCGAQVLIKAEKLQRAFETVEGLSFTEQAAESTVKPTKEVVFTCQVGVSACQGYIGFQ